MGQLTTHVLDTVHGCPGSNIHVELYAISGEQRSLLTSTVTNADGRSDQPLLAGDAFKAGEYELIFQVEDYFAAQGTKLPTPCFLGRVVIRFGVAQPEQHYHVPLLVSPYSYSTYRGS